MSSEVETYGDPATRTRILDAAWELLQEQDADIRLADVAARAGVSRQTVYLHFGDRTGLFVALGDHMDVTFGRDRLREHIFGAPNGVEGLRRWVETMSWYNAKIDPVSRILEERARSDEALAAMAKDRWSGRRDHVGRIARRIAEEGQLADGWSIDEAADLIYTVTLPGSWRVLTGVLEWSQERYATEIMELLAKSVLDRAAARSALV
jgi:AcrR family transcriptional regulator